MTSHVTVTTALGYVSLAATVRGLRRVTLPKLTAEAALAAVATGDPVPKFAAPGLSLAGVSASIVAYFTGGFVDFSTTPLDLSGLTDFQGRVLIEVQRIPRGQTMTYSEVATRVGNPKAARAVGAVMAANPVCIVVPCHRVVGAGGALTGFGGGLPLKRTMLALEGAVLQPNVS